MWKKVLLPFFRPSTFIKKRLQHRCFPVKFPKFRRTYFLKKNCERLLLIFYETNLRLFHCVKYRNFTNFLVRKFCGKAQFPHSFERMAQNYVETVLHTRKLGEIKVFYAVFGKYYFLIMSTSHYHILYRRNFCQKRSLYTN